ncbi:hypothetical protein PM082_021248 [Marasmius tenuissimus]|nr:hypothetical protein PM082_021248 [Marasmius tenuissimus]
MIIAQLASTCLLRRSGSRDFRNLSDMVTSCSSQPVNVRRSARTLAPSLCQLELGRSSARLLVTISSLIS